MNWDEDGVSKKSRLEQVWKQTGSKPAELEMEHLPVELEYLREVFWSIWNSEGWNWTELYHYGKIHYIDFEGFEIDFLRKAFSACMKFMNQKMKKKHKSSPSPKPPKGK